jgi:hypothetical protein
MGMSKALQEIIEEVKALGDLERRQLSSILQEMTTGQAGKEAKWEEELECEGFLSLPKFSKKHQIKILDEPLRSRGGPLSEMLIKERR